MPTDKANSNTNGYADASDPADYVVAFNTADEQLVLYDEHQPTAWIQSTRAIPITDAK
ncbi:DUF7331 family protein [Natrinema salsiterrestre]|uniref:Uncharacterized protein n=1 Tax=Natrinema salsiterrestre TaxID=2950540 RepID=A0A9Q4L4Q7_9EURY|nr:hypothetical protein [Natrinema salsiterrestre]MDF9748296.1 hypothetical protein [Natrinema salsiterrestre]